MPQNDPRATRPSDIDAHLKRAFDSLTEQAIPDRFNALLDRLRAEEGGDETRPAADDVPPEDDREDGAGGSPA